MVFYGFTILCFIKNKKSDWYIINLNRGISSVKRHIHTYIYMYIQEIGFGLTVNNNRFRSNLKIYEGNQQFIKK